VQINNVINKKVFFIGGWNGSAFIPDCDVLECDPNLMFKADLCNYAFDNELISDVMLISGTSKLFANKIILCSRSDFFKQIFIESPEIKQLDLSNFQFNVLYSVVEFLYKEEVNLARIGCDRSSVSIFLSAVEKLSPTVKPHLMERLILSRILMPSIFFEDLAFAWGNISFSDLTLVVSNAEFKVHKCILCCRSSYFRALLSSGLAESRQSIITLEDDADEGIGPIVFKYVLQYIYEDDVEVNEEVNGLVVEILISASKYGVTGCQELMEEIISHNLDIENVVSLTLVADLYRASKLAKSCFEFISHPNNLDAVFMGSEYLESKEEIDKIFAVGFYENKKDLIAQEALAEFEKENEKAKNNSTTDEEEDEDDEDDPIGLRNNVRFNPRACVQQ